MFVTSWCSCQGNTGASLSMIQNGFGETVGDVMDAEAEGGVEIHHSRSPRHGQARILLWPQFLETAR